MIKQFSFALCLFPSVLAAGPFDGLYKQTANSECGLVGVDGGALEIRDGIFFWRRTPMPDDGTGQRQRNGRDPLHHAMLRRRANLV